jgi:acyl-CoA thioesterase-1
MAGTKPIRVFFFGDSICFGQGVSLHHGWVPRLALLLAQTGEEIGRDVEVSNLSVNGNTTRLALERMPYDIQSHSPEILIVQFGMNDCNVWESDRGHPRVSAEAFEANLREIVKRARIFGVQQVFLHTNHFSARMSPMPNTDLTYEEANRAYNDVIRRVAADMPNAVELTDIEAVWREHLDGDEDRRVEYVLDDHLHLSVPGHDLYFESVAPRLVAAVRRIAAADPS